MARRAPPIKKDTVTRFKCVDCGRLTAGRIPTRREGGSLGPGDLSFRFPRLHKLIGGRVCPGVYREAEWVDVSWEDRRAPRLRDK